MAKNLWGNFLGSNILAVEGKTIILGFLFHSFVIKKNNFVFYFGDQELFINNIFFNFFFFLIQ